MRVARGAVIESDHYLVIGNIRVKLRYFQKRQMQKHSQRLGDWVVSDSFATELSNRFHALSDVSSKGIDRLNEKVNKAFIEIGTEMDWNLIQKRILLHIQPLNSKKEEVK